MTAEERMAYFQGEKRRTTDYHAQKKENNKDLLFLKIKFFIAVVLFIVFLSLDYTGYKINGVGSEEIIKMVTENINLPEIQKGGNFNLPLNN